MKTVRLFQIPGVVFLACGMAWSDTPEGQPDAINLALRKPTFQSSTYSGTGISQSSELGVDGIIAPDQDPRFLFHTLLETNPWWMVDLGAVRNIGEVHLHNRVVADAPEVAARARTAQVLLSDDGSNWTPVYRHKGQPFTVLRLPFKDARGRFVRIQLAEPAILHLYEVEVFGPAAPLANPPPTDLAPLPREEPPPPKPPPSLLAPVKAGKPLARAVIGPRGGQVEAPDAVTLIFPPGALAKDETITITTGPAVEGVRIYDINRTGRGVMPKPVQVILKVPENANLAEVLPIYGIAPSLFHAPGFQHDAKTRTVRMEANHFSPVGILLTPIVATGVYSVSQTDRQAATGVAAVLAGAIVADALYVKGGVAAILAVPGLGYVLVAALAGAVLVNVAIDAAYTRGLEGPFPVGKFRFYWPRELRANSSFFLTIDRPSRRLLAFLGPEHYSPEVKAGLPISFPNIEGTYVYQNLDFLLVPLSVIPVVAEFQYADAWYTNYQMPVPAGPTDVLIRNMDNPGEYFMGYIHLQAAMLGGEPAQDGAMSASIAHELFHFICAANRWREQRFVGSEDSLCVAMETMVFPYTKAFHEYAWGGVFQRLRYGLVRPGPDEGDNNPRRRGYYFWPWTRYLAHRHGIESLRAYAMGTIPDDVLAARFRNFCYSLIDEDRALPDPLYKYNLKGERFASRTGWKLVGRDLDRASEATLGNATARVPMGVYDFPPSGPLSFRVPVVAVPRLPRGVAIIRRERPEPTEEFVALMPALSVAAGELGSGHTTRDMVSMTGGVAVRGPWVDSAKFKDALPIAVICTATTFESAPQAGNRLLVYRLNPPSGVEMEKQPQKPTRLCWKLPDLGCNLKLGDGVSSYRVFGKTQDNRDHLIAELIFDAVPGSLPQMPGKLSLAATAGQTAVELPAAVTEPYVALGMQSVDKALLEPGGRQVMSDIEWSPLVYRIAIAPNPFEVTMGRPMEFDAKADFPPPGAQYRWQSTGNVLKKDGASAPVRFDSEGPASVTVALLSAAGKELCSATALGRAKKPEPPPKPPEVVKPEDKTPPPKPVKSVWRLAKIEKDSSQRSESFKRITLTETTADCKNVHEGDNDRLLYHCRQTWSAPPATLAPGDNLLIKLSAQYLVWPGDEPGKCSVFVKWGGDEEDALETGIGTKEVASKEFKRTLPAEGGGSYRLRIHGEGGWMRWTVDYLYEWVAP